MQNLLQVGGNNIQDRFAHRAHAQNTNNSMFGE
jgi:hypothetical protein